MLPAMAGGPADDTADLVRRARQGDAPALEALARRHLRAAHAVALSVVRQVDLAEDVAQDAFVVAMERLEDCREPARFAGWLLAIVRTRALNRLQSGRVHEAGVLRLVDAAPSSASPDDARVDLRRRLLNALAGLPQPQREVVLLHDLEGWKHGEIAAALGISEVMSRQHLFQARRTLRERLADEAEAEHGF